MSLFRNNYKKLVQENQYGLAEISGRSFKTLNSMMDYLGTHDVSLFELEVIKKDLIGLAKEADMEGIAFSDKIGMPQKEFCDSLVKDGMRQGHLERFIPLIRDIIITDFIFYTCGWWIEGMPQSYGFPTYLLILDAVCIVWQYIVMLRLQRKKAEAMIATKKRKETFYGFMMLLATFLFTMSGLLYGDTMFEFIVRGSGRGILFTLMVFSIAAFFGNNYYWDKCSEKYNWR